MLMLAIVVSVVVSMVGEPCPHESCCRGHRGTGLGDDSLFL